MNKKAFTLVEIMLVVGIIILLAAIAIPNLLRARVSANNASARATLKSISTALENYYVVNTVYPNQSTSLIGAEPPYLNKDYFNGTYNGFTFSYSVPNAYTYSITALPANATPGALTYTLTTGGVITPD
jgi:type II secretory pathway pseudopilin PulG